MSLASDLSIRMKEYESITQTKLIKKQPVILRLDGRAFSSFTKGFKKPFDILLSEGFEYVCLKLKDKVQNTKFIYSQSDEISILLLDTDTINTDPWFNNRISKIVSIASSLATAYFNEYIFNLILKFEKENKDNKFENEIKFLKSKLFKATFDCRAFNLPESEVCNYFIYRQKDAYRNAVQAMAQTLFSQKELSNKNVQVVKQLLKDMNNIDFDTCSNLQKYGFCVYRNLNENESKWIIDKDIPDFIVDRNYIEKYIYKEQNVVADK